MNNRQNKSQITYIVLLFALFVDHVVPPFVWIYKVQMIHVLQRLLVIIQLMYQCRSICILVGAPHCTAHHIPSDLYIDLREFVGALQPLSMIWLQCSSKSTSQINITHSIIGALLYWRVSYKKARFHVIHYRRIGLGFEWSRRGENK